MVRPWRLVLIALGAAAALSLGATAGVAGVTPSGQVVAGPVLAGDHAVWAEGAWHDRRSLWIAAPDGPARALWTAGSDCERVADFDASGSYLSFALARTCGAPAYETVRVRTDGRPWPLPPHPQAGEFQCGQEGSTVLDDPRVLTFRPGCRTPFTVHDLRTGAVLHEASAPDGWNGHLPGRLRFAGRFVAGVLDAGDREPRPEVVVLDLGTQEEVYRVPLRPWMGSRVPHNHLVDLALAPDGSVAAVVQDLDREPADRGVLLAASPAAPAARRLPVAVAAPDQYGSVGIALSAGRIAATVPRDQERVLIDHGTGAIEVFDRFGAGIDGAWPQGGLDWDGRRLVWWRGGIRNELHPHTPPTRTFAPAPQPAAPAPAAPAAPAASGRCRVPDVRRRSLAAARRAILRGGCRLGRVRMPGGRTESSRARGRLTVVAQRPSARARKARGARVNVTLARPRR